jgi:hypothetical protein
MGISSSKTVDSVSKEMNEIIKKLNDDKKRLEIFIQNRKTRATDQWSKDKESEDKEQMKLTGKLVALKTRLTELNKELDGLQSASASPAAASGTGSGSNSPAATSFNTPNTPNTQQIYNARNAPGPQGSPHLPDFEYPSSDSDSVDSIGGKIKRKNSKRKNSKRKNSKRKNSKRKNSKRKNSKSK